MNCLALVVILNSIFGNTVLHADAADLFGAIGSIMGIGNNNNQYGNPDYNNNNNQYLPNYNTDFNDGGQIDDFGGSSSNTDGLPFPSVPDNNDFGGSSTDTDNNQFRFLNPLNDQEATSVTGSGREFGLSPDEKLAAQQYPGIKNLLDKLKELNRQKELQKQKDQNGGNINNNNINNGNKNNNNNGGNINTNEVAKNGWKVLRRRKFAFQAKAVRPDNEIVPEQEVVYYLD